jgi:DNA-binding HxlR family transcriptional regulator
VKGGKIMPKKKRSPCPVACTLDLIGDRWTLLIIRDLACGKAHFKEFRESPERIATNILTDRLGLLVAHGLAETYSSESIPGRNAYRLTAKGKTLGPMIEAIANWGLTHIPGTASRMVPRFD